MKTINFLYFAYNFSMGQLEDGFKSLGYGDHFLTKFKGFYQRSGNGTQALFDTVMEMTDDNKEAFIDWIAENYSYKLSV